jgi:hypothetical protein
MEAGRGRARHVAREANGTAVMTLRIHRVVRRRFLVELGRGLRVAWPILSAVLLFQLALGLLVGFLEGWAAGETVYFTFVTGLTIGYGDLVPRNWITRMLALMIGLSGILVTGLVAAIAVRAMQAALPPREGH